MKIDELPIEILTKIIRYLPTLSCNGILLVNKHLNNIVCKEYYSSVSLRIDEEFCKSFVCGDVMDYPTNRLRIHRRFFKHFLCNNDVMDSEWLRSMTTSNRKITSLSLQGSSVNHFLNGYQRPIICLVERFSATINSVVYSDAFGNILNPAFLKILSLAPNIARLELHGCHVNTENQSSRRRRFYDIFNWKMLRSLSIFNQSLDSEVRRVVNIFGKLKLEFLSLNSDRIDSLTVAAMFTKQTKLKHLILSCCMVDDRVMSAISDCSDLEKLTTWVQLPDTSFALIRKLKKLKDLNLNCKKESTAKLEILAETDNTSLINLSVRGLDTVPVQLISTLAKSAPHLKSLNLVHSNAFGTEAHAIMKYFNFVETLELQIWDEPLVYQGDFSNPKLRDLKVVIGGALPEMWLAELMKSYPNLITLELIINYRNRARESPLDIRYILDGFTKLQSLTVEADLLIVGELFFLPDHKNDLKYVSLVGLEENAINHVVLSRLRRRFNVVALDYCMAWSIDRWIITLMV